MLNFFPNLYPDEFWYSALCRYHVRSGNVSSPATIRQLFPDRNQLALGSLFPNNLVYLLSRNLPEGVIDVNEIIIDHTLYKYCYRMHSYDEKIDMLNQLYSGIAETPTNLWRTADRGLRKQRRSRTFQYLKFCPLCKQEDIEIYGEAYWHISHQIPLADVCLKHKCRLIRYECTTDNQLSYSFILPDDYTERYDLDYNIKGYELDLVRTLYDFLHMPLEVGPTYSHNNLIQGIVNNGYGMYRNGENWTLDLSLLYQDLVKKYGTDIVYDVFGENIKTQETTKIRNWSFYSPERYALLSNLIEQPVEVMFGHERLDDYIQEELKTMSKEGKVLSKTYVAEKLGITTNYLDKLAKELDITPFWFTNQQSIVIKPKVSHIDTYLTENEKSIILNYSKTHGFKSASDFVRYCIQAVIDFKET